MRYRGSRLIAEPSLGTGLVPIRNRPGHYIRAAWDQIQCLKPYELFEQADKSILAQNVLKKRFTLESLGIVDWIHVGFEEHF